MDGPPVEVGQGGRGGTTARSRFWRDALRRRLLALSDLIAAAAASVVVASSSADAFWALALLPAWIVIAKLIGLYDRDHAAIRHLTFDELPALIAWAGAGVALLALVLPQTPAGEVAPRAAVEAFLVAAVGALLLRAAARGIWRRVTPPEVTAVIGDGDLAEMIRRKLQLFPDMHLSLLADGGRTALRRPDRGDRPGDLRLRADGPGRGRRPGRALPRAAGEAERDLAAARALGPGAALAGGRPAGARVRDLGSLALDGDDQARLRHRRLVGRPRADARRCSR